MRAQKSARSRVSRKIRLGVVFGGRSGEHEVSVASARSVIEAVDPEKYEIIPIGISKQGGWLVGPPSASLLVDSWAGEPATSLVADIGGGGLLEASRAAGLSASSAVDVIFPLLHGPFGEDGTVQGMLELAGVPYVGAGVAASAVGMDKVMMKAMFEHAQLPVVPYRSFRRWEWEANAEGVLAQLVECLGLPAFVKPARLGSSVGISKAETVVELRDSVEHAVRFDNKIIVEAMVEGREVECGVLGNLNPEVSVFGEIVTHKDFYDYEAKYTEGLAELVIPAELSSEQEATMRDIAVRAFRSIDAAGMARVDFFVERGSGRPILNEINTIPGFTQLSMFPRLWEASGVSYGKLVDRLVQLALERAEL
jgi:D-alanine-D-alanine ligase